MSQGSRNYINEYDELEVYGGCTWYHHVLISEYHTLHGFSSVERRLGTTWWVYISKSLLKIEGYTRWLCSSSAGYCIFQYRLCVSPNVTP